MMSRVVCFGEVLWDIFSTHKKIGGAPLNVALRLKSFNNYVDIISAVGLDKAGKNLLDYLISNDMSTEYIQLLETFLTGEVKVELNSKGSATYKIEYPRAWDKITLTTDAIHCVENADAIVFGSLVTRDETSRNTLFELLKYAKYKIFDLNLRPPYYNQSILLYLMEASDFIKFNDDELYEVCAFMGYKHHSLEQNIQFISEKTNTKHICVTKGSQGAVLLYNKSLYYNNGYKIKVVDTVGAGDSFLASLISKLLSQVHPQKAIDFACAVGALVAQNEGANPEISDAEITSFMKL